MGDRAMLRIVLDNLISNALKYTRPRPQAEIEIGCTPGRGAETVVFIRDNHSLTYSRSLTTRTLKRILMVEDDPKDIELTLTAPDEYNLANEVVAVRDGVEALDYMYRGGEFALRPEGK